MASATSLRTRLRDFLFRCWPPLRWQAETWQNSVAARQMLEKIWQRDAGGTGAEIAPAPSPPPAPALDSYAYFRHIIRANLDKTAPGLEMAPLHQPIVPKKDGYNVRTLDRADQETLRKIYAGDPNVNGAAIEPVDAVDDGRAFTELLSLPPHSLRYIISSHNLEHLPDPVSFLQRCEQALAPDGLLYLLIPDKRGTFDYLRPHSTPGAVLEAYRQRRRKHAPAALFDGCYAVRGNNDSGGIRLYEEARDGYARLLAGEGGECFDAHAWIFTLSSFLLLMHELRELGLIRLGIKQYHERQNNEFLIVLQRDVHEVPFSRQELLERMLGENYNPRRSPGSWGKAPPAAPLDLGLNASHVAAFPSRSTVVAALGWPWASRLPDIPESESGAGLFRDDRIARFIERVGVAGKSVLELGPLEGGHSCMLEQAGARVVGIEGNLRAFLKCLVVKNLYDLRAQFLLGDFIPYLESSETPGYDGIVASGVLYHQADPLRFLRALAGKSGVIYFWTHYYDPARPLAAVNPKPEVVSFGGREILTYLQSYGETVGRADFLGGMEGCSRWLGRESLLAALSVLGYGVEILEEAPAHPNGPAFGLEPIRIDA